MAKSKNKLFTFKQWLKNRIKFLEKDLAAAKKALAYYEANQEWNKVKVKKKKRN